jgi:hypothetical protein
VIVGVQATAARMSQETVAAQDMLTRFAQWQGREPESVAADTTYENGEFLQWLAERSITPYMRARDSVHSKEQPVLRSRAFYLPAGTQSLYLSSRPAPKLRRPQYEESHLCLYRDPQTLRSVRKEPNAPAEHSGSSPSTWTSLPGNAPASWQRHQSSPRLRWYCARALVTTG